MTNSVLDPKVVSLKCLSLGISVSYKCKKKEDKGNMENTKENKNRRKTAARKLKEDHRKRNRKGTDTQ